MEFATNHVRDFIFRGREVKQSEAGPIDISMHNYALSMKTVKEPKASAQLRQALAMRALLVEDPQRRGAARSALEAFLKDRAALAEASLARCVGLPRRGLFLGLNMSE